MLVKDFKPFVGQHCETTATGSLLKHLGIDLSEPMLFGLGEGLGFIFWKMKSMDFPFIGGRIKTDLLTQNICRNLNLELLVHETSSVKKAWKQVSDSLDQSIPVGLKLDCYHLDYFTNKIHFAGHYVAMYGYDEEHAYLVDTDQQGRLVQASLSNLALARNEKGPMASKNLSYTIQKRGKIPETKYVIRQAIKNNAQDYLNPPIKNFGYQGIKKTAKAIEPWFASSTDVSRDFQTTAMLMERAGTGGSLFRNLYRDFLYESATMLSDDTLGLAAEKFSHIAELWKEVSILFDEAGKNQEMSYLKSASDILEEISQAEYGAMKTLADIK